MSVGLREQPRRDYTKSMTTNLHAHIHTYAIDCDGPVQQSRVETLNDAERAEHEASFNDAGESVNDFHDYRFRERVLSNAVTWHPDFVCKVEITEAGFEVREETEEGRRITNVEWCERDCDPNERSYRDVYAEQMGY